MYEQENIALAEFAGLPTMERTANGWEEIKYRFHLSLGSMEGLIEKVEQTSNNYNSEHYITIRKFTTTISGKQGKIIECKSEDRKTALFLALYEFTKYCKTNVEPFKNK